MPEIDEDVLIEVPPSLSTPPQETPASTFSDIVKDCLSEPRYRIKLYDRTSVEVRSALHELREEVFPTPPVSTIAPAEFAERLQRYEQAVDRLLSLTILVARWGTEEQQSVLERIVARLANSIDVRAGGAAWLDLRWYPLTVLIYSGGIASLSAQNYRSLATLFATPVDDHETGGVTRPVLVAAVKGLHHEEYMHRLFKLLPGHERNYVPKSEYLFKVVQPRLDDLLFLGSSYERLFDRFEVFQALAHADFMSRGKEYPNVWGPLGRYAWKHRRGLQSPFNDVVTEARVEMARRKGTLVAG
ncbi:MAG: hypothetical protein U1E76_25435 [Planctomycetota bacterium]